MKTPITYYGGKQRMVSRILPLIPEHTLYCEPFAGGAAVLFAKPKSKAEVINDTSGEVVNFYKVCVSRFPELQKLIQSTPHSRQLHREAADILKNPKQHDELKRAWAFWVQTNMSFSSTIFGGYAFERRGNSVSKKINGKRIAFTDEIKERLELVDIECEDALRVIKYRDAPHTFFYIDPPYFNSDMGHYKGYTAEDFEKLLKVLSSIQGKFLLSSYPSEVLTRYSKKNGWKSISTTSKVAVTARTGKSKTEVLTANYDIEKMRKQTENKKKENPKTTINKMDAEEQSLGASLSENNDCYQIEERIILEFLSFHRKKVVPFTVFALLDEINDLLYEHRRITKTSPYFSEIKLIQNKLVKLYPILKGTNVILLDDKLIKKLRTSLKKNINRKKSTAARKSERRKGFGLDGIENKDNPRIMSSVDFVKLEFKGLGFSEKWKEFIGDPSKGFTAMVFGKPKFGKSYLCIEFAGYLARNHGKVLYVAREEELDATLKIKLTEKSVAHPNLFVSDHLPADLTGYDFIFLDSVSKLALTPYQLEALEKKYPSTSFIYIFQVRKDGVFKGRNEYQHDVDIVIEVPEKGIAIQNGRFNQGGEMKIFKQEKSESAVI